MFHVKHSLGDTIAAIATPIGEGGVGVVRVSGPASPKILGKIFLPSNGQATGSHQMIPGWLIDPLTKERLDQVMVCLMKAPRSYTGEDIMELFCHSGEGVLREVLRVVIQSGARLADRGEFTKRAFLNGKLDLTQAEAVVEMVRAKTRAGAGLAVRQLQGRLKSRVEAVRTEIMRLLAEIEARVDFAEDLAELPLNEIINGAGKAVGEVAQLIEQAPQGKLVREGVATVIIGKPNVGKSSLFNALLEEDRAIVTGLPGTTRDAIVETIDLAGISFRLADTAGLREPTDQVEEIGVGRAKAELAEANLILLVFDGSRELEKSDRELIELSTGRERLLVFNKADLGTKGRAERGVDKSEICQTSALTGEGLVELKTAMLEKASRMNGQGEEGPLLVNARHLECLHRAQEALQSALRGGKEDMPPDLIAIDLKAALAALGEITGEEVSDQIVERIFSQFCVGK